MNRTEYLLTQAASECNEVAHRITKALHFGLGETQPGQPLTNAQRIVTEFVELQAVVEMLHDEGHLELPSMENADGPVQAKKERVEHFMRYAADSCGTLQKESPAESPLRSIFLERERDEARRGLVAMRTQVTNALTELDDGNEEEAMADLRALAGVDA